MEKKFVEKREDHVGESIFSGIFCEDEVQRGWRIDYVLQAGEDVGRQEEINRR